VDVIRAFQDPPSCTLLILQMLQKPLVKLVGGEMAGGVDPFLVRWDVMRRLKPQALKDLRRDLRSFLWRIRGKRMQGRHLRCKALEEG